MAPKVKNPSRPAGFDRTQFRTKQNQEIYESRFKTSKILVGRRVEYEALARHGFDVQPFFAALGWDMLNLIRGDANATLCRIFLAHLYITEDFNLESHARGVDITITPSMIAEYYRLPLEGDVYYNTCDWVHPRISYTDALQMVDHDGRQTDKLKCPVNTLSPMNRVLMRILAWNFLPRAGHFDEFHYMDLYLLSHLVSGCQVNIPTLIARHLFESSSRATSSIAFGELITHFLRQSNVPERPDDQIEAQGKTTIGTRTLSLMSLIPNKRSRYQAHEGDAAEDSDSPPHPQPSAPGSSSTTAAAPSDLLAQMATMFQEQRNYVDGALAQQSAELREYVDEAITRQNAHLDERFHFFLDPK